MADVNDQVSQIKANSKRWPAATIRGVQGGFVVSGQVQYQDKTTGGVNLTENGEAVAADANAATVMAANWLQNGSFDSAPQQADTAQSNMFAGTATI